MSSAKYVPYLAIPSLLLFLWVLRLQFSMSKDLGGFIVVPLFIIAWLPTLMGFAGALMGRRGGLTLLGVGEVLVGGWTLMSNFLVHPVVFVPVFLATLFCIILCFLPSVRAEYSAGEEQKRDSFLPYTIGISILLLLWMLGASLTGALGAAVAIGVIGFTAVGLLVARKKAGVYLLLALICCGVAGIIYSFLMFFDVVPDPRWIGWIFSVSIFSVPVLLFLYMYARSASVRARVEQEQPYK